MTALDCSKVHLYRNRVISSSDDSDDDLQSFKILKERSSDAKESTCARRPNEDTLSRVSSLKKRCARSFRLFSSDEDDTDKIEKSQMKSDVETPADCKQTENAFSNPDVYATECTKLSVPHKGLDDFLLIEKRKSFVEDETDKSFSPKNEKEQQESKSINFWETNRKHIDSKDEELNALESVVEVYALPENSKGRLTNIQNESPKKSNRKKPRSRRRESEIPDQSTLLTLQDTFLFDTGNSDDDKQVNDPFVFPQVLKTREKVGKQWNKSDETRYRLSDKNKKVKKVRPPTKTAIFDAYSHTFRLIREQKVNLPINVPKQYDVDDYFECIRKRREEYRMKNVSSDFLSQKTKDAREQMRDPCAGNQISRLSTDNASSRNEEISNDIRTISTGVSFENPLNSIESETILAKHEFSATKPPTASVLPNQNLLECDTKRSTDSPSKDNSLDADEVSYEVKDKDSAVLKDIIELLYPDETEPPLNKLMVDGVTEEIRSESLLQFCPSLMVEEENENLFNYEVAPDTGVPKYAFNVEFALKKLDKFAADNSNAPQKLEAIEQIKSQLLDGSLLETFEKFDFFPNFDVESFDDIILVPRTPEISVASSDSIPIKITVPSSVPDEDFSLRSVGKPKLSRGSGFINLATQEVESSLPKKVDGFVRRLCKHVAMKITNKDDAAGQNLRRSSNLAHGSTHELKGLKKWYTVKEELRRRMKEKLFYRISNRLANLRGDFDVTSSVDEIPSSVVNDKLHRRGSTSLTSETCDSECNEEDGLYGILPEVNHVQITTDKRRNDSGMKPVDDLLREVIGAIDQASQNVSTVNNTSSYVTPYQKPAFEETDVEPRTFNFWEPNASLSIQSEKPHDNSTSFDLDNSYSSSHAVAKPADDVALAKNLFTTKEHDNTVSRLCGSNLHNHFNECPSGNNTVISPSQCSLTQLDRYHGAVLMKTAPISNPSSSLDSKTDKKNATFDAEQEIQSFPATAFNLIGINNEDQNECERSRSDDTSGSFFRNVAMSSSPNRRRSVSENNIKHQRKNNEDVVSLSDNFQDDGVKSFISCNQNKNADSFVLSNSKCAPDRRNSFHADEGAAHFTSTNRLSSRLLSNLRSISPSVRSLRLVLDGSDTSQRSCDIALTSIHREPQTKKAPLFDKTKAMPPFVHEAIERELDKSQRVGLSPLDEKLPKGELFEEFREACKIEPQLKVLMNDSLVYRLQRTEEWVCSLPTTFKTPEDPFMFHANKSQRDDGTDLQVDKEPSHSVLSPHSDRKRKSVCNESVTKDASSSSASDIFSESHSKKKRTVRHRIIEESDEERECNDEAKLDSSKAKESLSRLDESDSSKIVNSDHFVDAGEDGDHDTYTSDDPVVNEEFEGLLPHKADKSIKDVFEVKQFFDEEAELSGSDDGSGDEENIPEDDANDDDIANNDENFDVHQLKKEIGQIHLKRLLEDDKKELRLLKEKFLDGYNLPGEEKRKRKYHWLKADDAVDEDFVENNNTSFGADEDASDTSSVPAPELNFGKFRSILKDDESSVSSEAAEPKVPTQESLSNSFMQSNYYIVKEEQYNRFSWLSNPSNTHRQISFIGLGSQFLHRLSEISETEKSKSFSGPKVFDVDRSGPDTLMDHPVNDENKVVSKPKRKMAKRTSQRKDDVTIFGYI